MICASGVVTSVRCMSSIRRCRTLSSSGWPIDGSGYSFSRFAQPSARARGFPVCAEGAVRSASRSRFTRRKPRFIEASTFRDSAVSRGDLLESVRLEGTIDFLPLGVRSFWSSSRIQSGFVESNLVTRLLKSTLCRFPDPVKRQNACVAVLTSARTFFLGRTGSAGLSPFFSYLLSL